MVEKLKNVTLASHTDDKEQLTQYILDHDIHIDFIDTQKSDNHYSNAHYIEALEPFYIPTITKPININMAMDIAQKVMDLESDSVQVDEDPSGFEYFDIDFKILDELGYISYGTGYIPSIYYDQIEKELMEKGVFLIANKEEHVCYFLYFVIKEDKPAIDMFLEKYSFTYVNLSYKNKSENKFSMKKTTTKEYIENSLNISEYGIAQAYNSLVFYEKQKNIEKATVQATDNFVVYNGYMSKKDAENLNKQLVNNSQIFFMLTDIKEDSEEDLNVVPTKLKNNWYVKPFEFFVRSYSLPQYKEFDPTPLIALLYPLFFGMMFGDVGQGLAIFLLGFLFKPPIKNIVMTVGVFSMFFGFMYGSIFGFEHVLTAIWIQPTHHIETIIMLSVIVGCFVVGLCISINIFQKLKHKKNAFAGANGLFGLCFYLGVVLNIFFGVRLVFVLAMTPLVIQIILDIVNRPNNIFVIFIEAFENIMSYATNTLSFIRIGAIVLSHSAMMGAVFMLTGGLNLGTSIVVIGIGNIVVMTVEIMVVAIQALRLNYYEVFSRFYMGSGKEFVPLNKRI